MVITLLILAFASLAANQWHDRQSVEHIELVGASDLSSEAVQAIMETCLKQERRALMLSDVRDSIHTIPFVRSASVYFSGVRGVTAEIRERTPVAHVVLDDGSLRYVDAEGVVLPKTTRCLEHCIPVLRPQSLDNVPDLVKVLMAAREELSSPLYASVSEVVEEANGHVRVLADKVTWHLGEPEAVSTRQSFADMNLFWERAVRGRTLPQYAEIDLRWKHHVVIRQASKASRT